MAVAEPLSKEAVLQTKKPQGAWVEDKMVCINKWRHANLTQLLHKNGCFTYTFKPSVPSSCVTSIMNFPKVAN